ncbi:hypothetical protein N9D61_03890 [Planktomarina sp.]|jgi:hypothetical protein|nr:hypothetical protein [Planktomarina sp.]
MKMKDIVNEANYGDDPQTKMVADLGRRLMDMSAKMPMGKGVSDDDIAKSNRMSSFGDALTRFNTDFGPKNLKDVIKSARVTPQEAMEFIELAKKAKPAAIKVADPEPQDEPEDEFDDGPSDDEIDAQARAMARGK